MNPSVGYISLCVSPSHIVGDIIEFNKYQLTYQQKIKWSVHVFIFSFKKMRDGRLHNTFRGFYP